MGDESITPGKPKGHETRRDVDATIGFENHSITPSAHQSVVSVSKQCKDLAFANVTIAMGQLTERQLVRAIEHWTTHGEELLAQHLENGGAISAEQRSRLEKNSSSEIARISKLIAKNTKLSYAERDRIWLSRLDRSGKLGKLLGIGDDSILSPEDKQIRIVGARYTLLRKLGQGGLGTVWLARDENLRRYVAVKEITHQLNGDDQALSHFRREAEITGRLEHPGIVPVYQFGMDEETGRGFYAMRFLGKRTLQDEIVEYHERRESGNADPMMRHRLLTAFVNVCQAIAHAHSRNVIHRDLKPENIALDGFGQVVLLDWGLSKIDDETGMYDVDGQPEPGDLHNAGATLAGRVLGTPLYMAPEQAAGRLDDVDQLTDIYGLGGILYAILTGVAPHEEKFETGENSRTASDVFTTILSKPVRPPREVVQDVSPELNAICKKALSPKRYLRYESASKLAEDVQRYVAGASVSAYEAPVTQRLRRWMAAHPTSSQLLMLLASLVVLGGIAIAYTARQGRIALQQAHYNGLTEIARELKANLRFDAEGLVQDVRFVTELPLLQAVIDSRSTPDSAEFAARAQLPGSQTPPISDVNEVSEAEWIERLGTLFDGLLRANPAYLVMASCEIERMEIQELVRSERFAAASPSYRVPKSQLVSTESNDAPEQLKTLRPGEVMLITGDKLHEHVPTKNRTPLILVAVSPIFEQRTGELFGINLIELDMRKRLNDLLVSVAPEDVTVYITDAAGQIEFSYRDREFSSEHDGRSVTKIFPSLASVFDGGTERQYGDGHRLNATRVRLGTGPSQAEIGIVAELHESSD